ncbi:hypothetical protein GUJ93_ZPchr0013g37878 [Zizania palustris]|uniref:Uncharacterized protein n=1 Tax=Zizania palustris TaxID=103762 RepID=A0A8J5X0J2_ZIZPA|nr:hypothetical protein GUJ93_ZPchr0013g37878 [Zizania palustris]
MLNLRWHSNLWHFLPTPVVQPSSNSIKSGMQESAAKTSDVLSPAFASIVLSPESRPKPSPPFLEATSGSLSSIPVSAPKVVPSASESAVATTTRKAVGSNLSSNEDDTGEEVPSTSSGLSGLNLGWEPLVVLALGTHLLRLTIKVQSVRIGSGKQLGLLGQPAQIGTAEQSGFEQHAHFGAQLALGSVLGSFGQ